MASVGCYLPMSHNEYPGPSAVASWLVCCEFEGLSKLELSHRKGSLLSTLQALATSVG